MKILLAQKNHVEISEESFWGSFLHSTSFHAREKTCCYDPLADYIPDLHPLAS